MKPGEIFFISSPRLAAYCPPKSKGWNNREMLCNRSEKKNYFLTYIPMKVFTGRWLLVEWILAYRKISQAKKCSCCLWPGPLLKVFKQQPFFTRHAHFWLCNPVNFSVEYSIFTPRSILALNTQFLHHAKALFGRKQVRGRRSSSFRTLPNHRNYYLHLYKKSCQHRDSNPRLQIRSRELYWLRQSDLIWERLNLE